MFCLLALLPTISWSFSQTLYCVLKYITVVSYNKRETEDEYSDDDDMSWKVRRSAAKCLEAVVSTRHDMLPEFYKTVSPALITRFKGKV